MKKNAGFSLLELSIVLVIIAVLLAGGAVTFRASVEERQIKETKAKMAVIQKTLIDYRRAFNRIPCPASPTRAINSAGFGDDLVSGGTGCYDSGGGILISGDIYAGAVPTRILNLPDDYAIDGWGFRFMYAVHEDLTLNDGFSTVGINDTDTRITVTDGTSNKTTSAVYVLVSFGPDGHGAYPRNGGSRIYDGSTNTQELENCDCTATAAGAFDTTFVQRLPTIDAADLTDQFDDIVVYADRRDLFMLKE